MITVWDHRHLKLAREVASWSKDPRRKVGCFMVTKKHEPISYGYNGFPSEIDDSSDNLTNDDFRRKFMIHAETNAIRLGDRDRLRGATAYIWPFLPCQPCTSMLLGAGIDRIVTTEYAPEHWVSAFSDSKKVLGERVVIYQMSDIRQQTTPYDPAFPLN